MPIPVIAAVAGGAVLEATTGLVSKTFKKARKPRKAKKSAAKKTTRRKTTAKKTRKPARKKATKRSTTKRKTIRRKTTTKKSTPKSAAINRTTGRLKKGFKYSKGGRIVKTKKK